MRLLGTAVVLAASVATSSCGSQEEGDRAFHGCRAADVPGAGVRVARADLDGDGRPDRLVLTGSRAACPDSLVGVVGDRVVGTSVTGLDLVATGSRVLRPAGQDELVLLRSRTTADGHWRPHLFAAGGAGGLTDVTVAGRPLLPLVSTQPGGAPMDVACTPRGTLAVTTSKAHQPPGIVLAWDVRRTTYRIHDGVATRLRTTVVQDAAADPLLRRDHPELYDGRLLDGCG
jgi:hypothetical protein